MAFGLALAILAHAGPPSFPEESIYQLNSQWKNSAGKLVSFANLSGTLRVLAMGYTSCPYACPRMIADMRTIEKRLPKEAAGKVNFTFVSFDSEKDTPEHLRDFQRKNGLHGWTLLTGDEESAQELSVALGIQLQKTNDGGFAHSTSLFVLSPTGVVLLRQDTLGTAPDEAVNVLCKALRLPSPNATPGRPR